MTTTAAKLQKAAEDHQSPDAPAKVTSTSFSPTEWSILVEQIKAGQDAGMAQLYKVFSRGIRYYLYRQLNAQDVEDKVHDTFLIVVRAIQRGDLREPERLLGFVRTVVRRQVAAYIEEAVHTRRDGTPAEIGLAIADQKKDPEQAAIIRQKAELMKSSLSALSPRDRDILVRFYLQEQSQEQICREMSLTETQFRLCKSRAKAKFGEVGRKKLTEGRLFSVFLRRQAR